jgi:ribonuclease Z
MELCRDADGLVIEATYLEAESDLAKKFGHLTAKEAATLALEAGVGKLLLTHISRRYHESQVLEEAKQVFPDVSVVRDFDRFSIKRDDLTEG